MISEAKKKEKQQQKKFEKLMNSRIKGLDYEIKPPFNHRGSNITNRTQTNK
jgi:hypothetical protein